MRRRLNKLLFPGWGWVLLVDLLGGVALALAFLVFGEYSPFAYIAYLFSAYALTILVAAILAPALRALRRFADGIPLARRYLTDSYFRIRSGLALSLAINLCYAVFKLFYAVRYTSLWDGALAAYYVLLCMVRFYLIAGC